MAKNNSSPTFLNSNMGNYANSDWHEYYECIVPLIPDGITILDIGSGRGGLADYLQRFKGCKVTCIDSSKEAIGECKRKNLKTFYSNLNENDFESIEKFDLVLFSSSLESFLDPHSILQKIKYNIIQGGSVLIWLPNYSFLLSLYAYIKGKSVKIIGYSEKAKELGIRGYDDIQFFNKSTLELMLDETGYSDLKWFFEDPEINYKKMNSVIKKIIYWILKIIFIKKKPELFSSYLCVLGKKK